MIVVHYQFNFRSGREKFITFFILFTGQLEKLCGRRNRMQKNSEEFKLIDINQDAVLADSKILLSKQLTEETTYKSSHKKNEGPSNVQKRKHQITYLAHQVFVLPIFNINCSSIVSLTLILCFILITTI